ncbi:MAG: HAD family hydrolase [Frankiaceae bacterium]
MSPAVERDVAAVTLDLDDTLYPQADYLDGAWRAVARAAGLPLAASVRLHEALVAIAAEGSDRGGIINRALGAAGLDAALAPGLVSAFRQHAPQRLWLYPGAREALAMLRAVVPVACITDGDPAVQRAKLSALGLDEAFDAVVISDEHGRAHRKPDPLPFRLALDALGVQPGAAVHIGDRHGKDVVGAVGVGMRAIRVLTGEYAHLPHPRDGMDAWATCTDVVAATALVMKWLPERRAAHR